MTANTREEFAELSLKLDAPIVRGPAAFSSLLDELAPSLNAEERKNVIDSAKYHESGALTCLLYGPVHDRHGEEVVLKIFERLGYSEKLWQQVRGLYCSYAPPAHYPDGKCMPNATGVCMEINGKC